MATKMFRIESGILADHGDGTQWVPLWTPMFANSFTDRLVADRYAEAHFCYVGCKAKNWRIVEAA